MLPEPGTQTGGCGSWMGRGHRLTWPSWKYFRSGEKAVADVVLGREVEGADAARAGHPDRRVRLLDGPRPQVDLAELEVLPIWRESSSRRCARSRSRRC